MEPLKLRFVSWNVGSVKNKILRIIEELSRENAEIAFLQETHIGSINYRTLLDNAVGWKSFFTVYSSQSKGVAILIKNDVPFKYICHDEDYSGGYLVLFCYLHDELFTLVNVYNHKHDKEILNRLQDYLSETAEGVLVVGGDFNTVLDLTFDRKSMTDELTHTPLKNVFEKFTTSLNLMDTWVHKHPTDKAFTRSEKDSFSRLDMFLVPEDILNRVCNVKICTRNLNEISDHKPIVLGLTLRKDSRKKKQKVVNWIKKYTYSRDDRAGMISGAEILSVINSMTDSDQPHPDGISIQSYKMHRCLLTEDLKKKFNKWLNRKQIPDHFKTNTCATGTRKIFNVDYLIFATIVAKRLSVLCPKNKHPKTDPIIKTDCYIATFSTKPVRIEWAFLKEILSDLCRTWREYKPSQQPLSYLKIIIEALGFHRDFWVLDYILPKVRGTNGDIRELQEGCPLTRPLMTLILRYLEIHITENDYDTHICHFRQVLVMHKNIPEYLNILEKFHENGILEYWFSENGKLKYWFSENGLLEHLFSEN